MNSFDVLLYIKRGWVYYIIYISKLIYLKENILVTELVCDVIFYDKDKVRRLSIYGESYSKDLHEEMDLSPKNNLLLHEGWIFTHS
jgi:hypothetical protein